MTDTLFGTGLQGKSANITAQRRINCYYENTPDGDKTIVAIIGTPGLEQFVDFGDTAARGFHAPQWNDFIYVVHRSTLYEVNNAGTKTNRGTLLTSSGRVSMANNGTEIGIVDGTYMYVFNTSTNVFAQVTDVDLPSSPQTITFEGGRFLVNKGSSGQFNGSDTYAGTSWNALNFATAESQPDNLVRVDNLGGEVVLWGTATIEFWANTGLPGFPYARIGGANQEYGLAAKWSVSPYMGSLAFLARVRNGQVIIGLLDGYNVKKISTFELDSTINGYSTVLDASAYSYILGGHPMYQINFPTAGKSWLFDGQLWNELKSKNLERHRAEFGTEYLNNQIVADYTNGKLYKLKPDVFTDNGDEIRMELTSRHLYNEGENIRVNSFQVDGEMGVGLSTGQGSDPQMMIRVSKDGGHTFANEIMVPMGKVGAYTSRAKLRRLGRAQDWVFNIAISDPVKRIITGVFIR
jgi:hypothetical protein